jgi:hypothetical protein
MVVDTVAQGFLAGAIGSLVKNGLSWLLSARRLVRYNSVDLGSILLLCDGHRRGWKQRAVGILCGIAIGGGYGSLLGLFSPPGQSRRYWVIRGVQSATLVWALNQVLGRKALESLSCHRWQAQDALTCWGLHLTYGLTLCGLMSLWEARGAKGADARRDGAGLRLVQELVPQ